VLSYGDHAGSAGPLREGKGTMFEGGCREPTIFWVPAASPRARCAASRPMTIDLLPTVAQLLGAALPEHKIDGRNIWPLISGETGRPQSPGGLLLLLWKRAAGASARAMEAPLPARLYYPEAAQGRHGGARRRSTITARIEESLFDLEKDPGERPT
jgi:arylsulfatase A-like enzyme